MTYDSKPNRSLAGKTSQQKSKSLFKRYESKKRVLAYLHKLRKSIQEVVRREGKDLCLKPRYHDKLCFELSQVQQRIERSTAELAELEVQMKKKSLQPEAQSFNQKKLVTPSELEDILDQGTRELNDAARKIQNLAQENQKLKEQIQSLSEENKRLKDLPAKPNLQPNAGSSDEKVIQGKKRKKKRKRGGSSTGKRKNKFSNLPIHQTVQLPHPEKIPQGFLFKGYQKIIVQDLLVEVQNTQYFVPKYYNPFTNETVYSKLPDGIMGHFGGELRAFILELHHQGRMTESKIMALLKNKGIEISSGQIHNLVIKNLDGFHQEKRDILDTGLQVSEHINTDEGHARHCGKNGYCNVICNDLFTVFHTTESKSRLNFLSILSQGADVYLFNEEALLYLERLKLPEKWSELFKQGFRGSADSLSKILKKQGLTSESKIYQNVFEAGLLGYLIEKGIKKDLIIHSDGAKQFDLFVHCLCWIHAVRPFKKLVPISVYQKKLLEDLLGAFWSFYEELCQFKDKPSPKKAELLDKKFDSIFQKKTSYQDLQDALDGIIENKHKLLLVLTRHEAPLHNNGTETEVREFIVRNQISKTGSQLGKECRDTFLSLMKTTRKLGIPFSDYLRDRILKRNQIDPLGVLIRRKALSKPPILAVA